MKKFPYHHKGKGTRIDSNILLRIFRRMKSNPKRTYIAKEFGNSQSVMRYLDVLVILGLVEYVPVFYRCGRSKGANRRINGFRLINHKA